MVRNSLFQEQAACSSDSSEDNESEYEAGLSSVGSSFIDDGSCDDHSSIGDSGSSDTESLMDDHSAVASIIAAAFPASSMVAPLHVNSNNAPPSPASVVRKSPAAIITPKRSVPVAVKAAAAARAKPISPAAAARKAMEEKEPGDITFPVHCWSLTVTKTKDDVSVALLHVFCSFIETYCIRGEW